MSQMRAVIVMLHSIVKGLAERSCDHELLKRSLDVYEIDADGSDVVSIYAACYKSERARLISIMQLNYKMYGRGSSRAMFYLAWLSRFDSADKRSLSNVIHNCGSRNFDTFSDDNTFRGKPVKVGIARARVKVAKHKREQTEVRGYQLSKRHHTF